MSTATVRVPSVLLLLLYNASSKKYERLLHAFSSLGKIVRTYCRKRFVPLKSGGWPRGMLCSFRMTHNRGT
jgi:hypothetical protein